MPPVALQGTRLAERYDLHQQISHKAGRQTFLAQDTQTQAQVVIKIIQLNHSPNGPVKMAAERAEQWTDLKLFERETHILKNLDHPAIPKYRDFFETDIGACIALYWYKAISKQNRWPHSCPRADALPK
ncbi:MAG: hypothetical protein AAFN12_02020 [Cyanobacteria bacterium J06560_2]